MASARQENTILPQHTSVIDELLKEPENIALPTRSGAVLVGATGAKPEENNDVMMKGKIRNDTRGPISFTGNKDWSGSVFGSYPSSIDLKSSSTFSHSGTPPEDPKGSKGAVVYHGTNRQGGAINCAWVFAWSVPGDGSPNKVYVDAGPSTKYPKDSIEWGKILTELDKSSGGESSSEDPNNSKAQASAKITDGNLAIAAVVFDV